MKRKYSGKKFRKFGIPCKVVLQFQKSGTTAKFIPLRPQLQFTQFWDSRPLHDWFRVANRKMLFIRYYVLKRWNFKTAGRMESAHSFPWDRA